MNSLYLELIVVTILSIYRPSLKMMIVMMMTMNYLHGILIGIKYASFAIVVIIFDACLTGASAQLLLLYVRL